MRAFLFQRSPFRICLLLPLFVCTAVAEPPATAPKKTPEKVVVRGIVVDEKGKPVAGASVRGVAVQTWRQGTMTSVGRLVVPERKTDDKGSFTLEVMGTKSTLALHLSARRDNACTARALEIRGDDLEKPITLTISPRNARALRVRVVDEEGKPVEGAAVVVRQNPGEPQLVMPNAIKPVDLPKEASRTTDHEGRLATPPCLAPDSSYQVEVSADGFLTEKTPWKEISAETEIVFEATLRRLRSLEGQILDRQGKPIYGARVVRSDERHKTEAVTDKDGRFQLQAAFFPPGFLFVSKSGYRFHGQRCDRPESVKITLTRRDERAPAKMTTLPPALPRAQRKELAARLLEPLLKRNGKEDDNTRSRALRTLGKLDAGRLLAELSSRPMKDTWFDGYIRRTAVDGLKEEAPEEAQAVAASMKDPSFCSMAYLDLCDALPEARTSEKRTLLHQALLHARAIQASDHRIIQLAWVARRLWAIGDKELATRLLREGQEIARELPTAGWSAYARGVLAENLGLIDVDAALALMKDLKDPHEFVRHHGNLAHKLAGTDPNAAERVFKILVSFNNVQSLYQRDQYAVRICYRMASADLARARKIADAVRDTYYKARCYGLMAQTLARSQPREARELLERAFDLLEKHVASGQDSFNNMWDAASLAGLMLPAAEAMDPSLVPEFFWRVLSLHGPPRSDIGGEEEWSLSKQIDALGAVALVLARYDREIALVVIEAASKRKPSLNFNRFPHLQAAALADPRRAVALVEEMPESGRKEVQREYVADLLLAEGDAAWKIVHGALGQWFVDDEDL